MANESVDAETRQCVTQVLAATLPDARIEAMNDANGGRGVFSSVVRVVLAPSEGQPDSVIVKLPLAGGNGVAARISGAYDREAYAYRSLLPHLDVDAPRCFGIVEVAPGPALVLEDLGLAHFVDQLEGLEAEDAMAVARSLAALHRAPLPPVAPGRLRSDTASTLDPTVCRRGLDVVARRWSEAVSATQLAAFRLLVDRSAELTARLAACGAAVLCHGDPRADNVAFRRAVDVVGPEPTAVLFDWQQVALQPGVADLAWLLATSFEPAVRQAAMDSVVAEYATTVGRSVEEESMALGFVLPGLAVLYLAQREVEDARSERFVATSLRRIGEVLVDLDIAQR